MADIFNMLDTWTDAGTTYTSIKMNATNTASSASTLLMDLQVGGASQFSVSKTGIVTVASSVAITNGNLTTANGYSIQANGAGSSIWARNDTAFFAIGTSADTILARDAANTLAQRNGTNAQAFRVYNTYTDASNYERQEITFQSNVVRWFSTSAGTGTLRNMEILRGSTQHWLFNSAGNNFGASLLASTDNTYDIGASSANRPRNIYAASSITSAGNVTGGSGSYLRVSNGNAQIGAPTDGVMLLYNAGGSDFTRLQFGGTTNSFGAIARDGAGISIVGGASGSTAHIKVPGVTVANLPAAVTAGAGARSFVTDALTPTFGSAVTGGGAVNVPVYSTGSAWNVG
jgi:hypothetical protein